MVRYCADEEPRLEKGYIVLHPQSLTRDGRQTISKSLGYESLQRMAGRANERLNQIKRVRDLHLSKGQLATQQLKVTCPNV
jgi:hypothetical protein